MAIKTVERCVIEQKVETSVYFGFMMKIQASTAVALAGNWLRNQEARLSGSELTDRSERRRERKKRGRRETARTAWKDQRFQRK